MASYYQRRGSPYYWIRFKQPDGRWHSKSSGIKVGLPNSEARVARICVEMTGKEKAMTLERGSAFDAWVPEWMAYKYRNPKTLHRYQNAWVALTTYFRQRRMDHPAQVTYQVCHDFLRWRSDAELARQEDRRVVRWNTALTEVRVLGAVMQEAVRRGYVAANPTARLGATRRDTAQKREITPDEIAAIEAALPKQPVWMQDSWVVYMRQGCRLSEAEVPLERIDEATGTITFRLKGGKLHTTALHPDVAAIAQRRRKQEAEVLVELPPSPSKEWINFFRSLGIEGISIHCTRVTAITRLARAGLPEVQTKEFIGHCSDEVHAIYRRFNAADLAHVARALG